MPQHPQPAASDPGALLLAATTATRQGDLGTAAARASEALEGFRLRADNDGRMRSQNLLGVIAYETGRMEQAELNWNDALDTARGLKDNLMIARASNNLASLTYLRNDTLGALTLFRSALLSYQRLGDRKGMAESYHNLGIIFREMEEWGDAMDAAREAIRLAEQVGEGGLIGLAATGRAEISVARAELALAQQELNRAGQMARDSGDELGVIEVARVQALLFLAGGDYQKAADEAEAARVAAEQANALVLQAECAAVAARSWRRLDQPENAESRRQEALRLFRSQGALRRVDELERQWQRRA